MALRSGDESATNILLRLWGFCQERKRWRFTDLGDQDLDNICRAINVKPHLIAAGFLQEKSGVLIVHDWENMNAQLVSCWRNGSKGGRPIKITRKPNDNPTQTERNPRQTHRNPPILSNPILSNQPVATNSTNSTRPSTEDELVQYCTNLGLDAGDGQAYWEKWLNNGFTNDHRPMKDWKAVCRCHKRYGYFPSQKQSHSRRPVENQI